MRGAAQSVYLKRRRGDAWSILGTQMKKRKKLQRRGAANNLSFSQSWKTKKKQKRSKPQKRFEAANDHLISKNQGGEPSCRGGEMVLTIICSISLQQ